MSERPEVTPQDITTMKVFMTRHIGSGNRVSPEKLAEYMYGKPTTNNIRKCRAVRREINADDTNDILIMTDRDEGGFYLATRDDKDNIIKHIMEEDSIAKRELEKVSAMKRKAVRKFGVEFDNHPGQGRLL